MSQDIKKLNSMRFLEAQKVTYEAFSYSPDIVDGVHAAEAMGASPSEVYKTLVVQVDNEHALVMIASDRTLDLKQFARAIGKKKATMTTKRGAEAATGLKTGGIGALALTMKRWGVYLDEQAKQHEAIFVNGGQRGVNLKVKVDDLVRVLNARVVDVSKPMEGAESDEGE
ncbi:MAG TPA: YbaK/EbsC family protein [Aggregatilinea sp.]|jgi:Cys-tRNA(Pro)/Cys-tRNA(Cys) deacylase|uniref:YbaK/EbsC family protein n=1 Tax=Aggregatilinea sp. TaxID=2806333 RepID=UPI002C01B15F|nr:YbaK/EbsC family protein [Aggregatilinea sp.]HML23899.1 YbaK/EbsC family protein [Aggregatilinea sp.]